MFELGFGNERNLTVSFILINIISYNYFEYIITIENVYFIFHIFILHYLPSNLNEFNKKKLHNLNNKI